MNLSSRKSYIKLVLLSLILIFIIYFIAGPVSADTINVDYGGGGAFTSIQEAIDAANESDTISVSSGKYNEAININKSIILLGEGSNTIINNPVSGVHTIFVQSNNVTISGFTIQNIGDQNNNHSCIRLDYVRNCEINNINAKYGGNTIYLVGSHDNTISDNIIEYGRGTGIFFSDSDGNIITQNFIQNNNAYGICFSSTSSSNTIYNNDFYDNSPNNARDLNTGPPNLWSYNQQGNYWDDYNDYDMDDNGIGDSPYIIDANSQDMFPLGDFLSYNQKPIANIGPISPNPAIKGQTITFQGHGTPNGEIIDWRWTSSINGDFGSSSEVTTSSLSTGTHNIGFKVYDGTEWSDYDTATLVITDPPSESNQPPEATIVTIDPISSTEGEPIYFHGYGVDTDGTVTGYSWRSSKDGVISSSPTFTQSDLSAGTHNIYFKVKDNDGDWSTEVSRQITIMENQTAITMPIAVIECPVYGVINHSLRFDASKSYVPDDPDAVLSFSWDFGDGKSGTGEIITHSYETIGNYTITLSVQDSLHHVSSKTASLTITNVSTEYNPADNSTDGNGEDSDDTPGFGFAALICGISVFLFINIRRKR